MDEDYPRSLEELRASIEGQEFGESTMGAFLQEALRVLRKPYIPMLAESNVRTGFLGELEYLTLHEALPAPLNHILTFAYTFGWRKSEVLGLTWDRVDFGAGTDRLDPGTTKNREGRTIVLTDSLRATLR